MADPQEYTDAQLLDGTTLRFIGQLGPDEIKQKVGRYRATKAISANPPGVPRPRNPILPSSYPDIVGPDGGPSAPGAYEASSPLTPREALKEGARTTALGATYAAQALVAPPTLLGRMALMGGTSGAQSALMGGDPKDVATSAALGAGTQGLTEGTGAVLSKAPPKVQALGKLGVQYGVSKIPIVGGFVRRPSYGDLLEAIQAKPPAAFLRANQPSYPGASLPATPPPEVLNPALTSPSRSLPGQIGREVISRPAAPTPASIPRAAPIPPRSGLMLPGEVASPASTAGATGDVVPSEPFSLLDRIRASRGMPERRGVDPSLQGWYKGPERRAAIGGAVPPENQGFNFSPPEDLGNKVRPGTEAKFGPMKRNQKVLGQAEALRDAPRQTLIEQMGGKPPESITEPEDMRLVQQMRVAREETKASAIERARAGPPKSRPAADLLPGDPGYKWKMRRN